MIKGYCGSVYGNFRTRTFSDIYETVDKFIAEYTTIGIPTTITNDTAKTLYYILYANFGNSHIASSDENRFQYQLFSIIWQYGPTWEREVAIQKRLRELSEDDLLKGSTQIYNNAQNPGTEPTTETLEELQYINNQNVTKSKKGVLEAYGLLMSLLRNDVTTEFINRFKKLFIVIAQPDLPLLYEEIQED